MKSKFRFFSLLALCWLISSSLLAQSNGGIQGKVKEQNGKALSEVNVMIERVVNAKTKEKAGEIKTNSQGEFSFSNLPAGNYVLTFELSGFRTFVTRRFEITAGETYKVPRAIEMSRERETHSL
ncbi:MAG TPA: carboxypeptidase-like regulatory domain-containing protein, partial [Blastocatellia bacterium]|nr:carboxypeptidase-like regulatory domain-containing protein [Blastocatellia bacterium]